MQQPATDQGNPIQDGAGLADAPRFRSLDAWRGIAAMVVAAVHLDTLGWINQSALVQNAGRFVDFFFVLSGFVIAHAYRAKLESGWIAPFVIRRIGRLWPLHLAVLAAMLLMAVVGGAFGLEHRSFDYAQLPANVTLTHAWGFAVPLSWNGPSWSISAEMFAYLGFAILAWMFRGVLLDIACALIFVASAALLFWMPQTGHPFTVDLLARCLFGFMAGVLASRLWQLTNFRPRGEIPALALTFLAVAYMPGHLKLAIVPLFAWVVLVYASDRGPVSRALHQPFPQLLGRISYSIYMTHYAIVIIIKSAMTLFTDLVVQIDESAVIGGPWWLGDGLTLAYLAVVVGVSCLTYTWIESPGRRLFNRGAEPVPAAW